MRKALVVIDMQEGFINNNTRNLVGRMNKFIDEHKNGFEVIIATQYVNHEKTPCYIFEGWKDCMKGTKEANVIDSVLHRVDCVIEKDVYSCWNDKLVDILRKHNTDKVYFIGVNTGCCVLHSAFDAYNDLQDCAVIEDLCGSTSGLNSHRAAIQVLRECITEQRVIKSEHFNEED